MKRNWFLPALAVSAAMIFSACGDDSSTSSTPVVTPSDPVPGPVVDPGAGTTPQPVTTQTYGILPTTANALVSKSWYDAWKATYYKSYIEEAAAYPILAQDWGAIFSAYTAAGMYPARIIWDTSNDSYCVIEECTNSYKKRGCTVSEGIGYGMLLTLFAGDLEAYNALWVYNRGYRQYNGGGINNLMPWRTGTYSFESLGSAANASSATDADLDIATSLVIAHFMTGQPTSDYLNDALLVMASIWDAEISPTLMIYSGNTPTWKTATAAYNLSYFSPVALKLFVLVDPSHDWTGVLNKMYEYMIAVQNAGTGVFPDWSDANGAPIDPKNGSATKTYWRFHHEAVRIPWRIAWDYYWTQDPRALLVLKGMNDFIVNKTAGSPDKLTETAGGHIYSAVPSMPDSTLKKQSLQAHWHGAWCLTGMGVNQAWMDACTASFNQNSISGFSYFPHILTTMYGELLNGLFIKPAALPL